MTGDQQPKNASSASQSSGAITTTKNEASGARSKLEADLEKWQRYLVWPMFFLSLVFVALTAFVIAPPKGVSGRARALATTGMLALWLIFIASYVVRMLASSDRKKFVKTQSFELLTLLIPYLRPFLLIRYVWRLSYFRHKGANGLRGRAIVSIALFALFFVYTLSTLVWVVERGVPHANIVNWGDAIWWGFVTISTVGYGIFYPVTFVGRLLSVVLMVGGMFVIGVTSATIISAFNQAMTSFLEDAAPKDEQVAKKHGHALMEVLSMGALQEDGTEAGSSESSSSSPETTKTEATVASK